MTTSFIYDGERKALQASVDAKTIYQEFQLSIGDLRLRDAQGRRHITTPRGGFSPPLRAGCEYEIIGVQKRRGTRFTYNGKTETLSGDVKPANVCAEFQLEKRGLRVVDGDGKLHIAASLTVFVPPLKEGANYEVQVAGSTSAGQSNDTQMSIRRRTATEGHPADRPKSHEPDKPDSDVRAENGFQLIMAMVVIFIVVFLAYKKIFG
ncbi:unnamed protein product, partial [Mesorhabditis spiculigera]